jgi:hypothetical protein
MADNPDMELKLSVPESEQGPNLTVETRPDQVKEWLEKLQKANIGDAAYLLCDRLATLNRQKMAGEERLGLLELYRAAVVNLLPSLKAQFVILPLPLPEKNRRIAELTRQMFVELANGYKIALLEHSGRLISFGGNKQLPVIVQRALASLAQALAASYEIYAPVPAGTWSEIHQLYRFAVKQEIQDEPVKDGNGLSSAALIYKQALLLALADPYHLRQGEVIKILDYLSHFGDSSHIQPASKTVSSPAGLFLVRTDGDAAPKPLNPKELEAGTGLVLNALPLARLLFQQLSKLEAGDPPANVHLPESAKDLAYQDLLRRLLKHWGATPKRVYGRRQNNATVEICVGIRALHHLLGKEKAPPGRPDETGAGPDLCATGIHETSRLQVPSRWTVTNESAGGLALTQSSVVPPLIRAGEIVGIKAQDGKGWTIGVVRWIKSGDSHRLDMGVQMLAPKAEAVAVKPAFADPSSGFQPGLLLPEIPLLKQPATLVSPRGVYHPQGEILLEQDGQTRPVRAGKIEEYSASFEQFQFAPV